MREQKKAPWGLGKEDYQPSDESENCELGCGPARWESKEAYEGEGDSLFEYPRPLYFCQECYEQLPNKRETE